ncbi:hypothetical protein HOI18_01750 [Candidatus Uhrbacteria bacterium]|nr:hypothetical protein [Candidatus Uhrbacteria bacterium]
MINKVQADLQRDIAQVISGDAEGVITADVLRAALEFLEGDVLAMGEHDVMAIPIAHEVRQLSISFGPSDIPQLTALVIDLSGDAPTTCLMRRTSEDQPSWVVCSDPGVQEFRLIEGEDPACLHFGETGWVIRWGILELGAYANIDWRISMSDAVEPKRVIDLLSGDMLLTIQGCEIAPTEFDTSSIVPRWNAKNPQRGMVCRDADGTPWLQYTARDPQRLGDAHTQVFDSGGEIFTVKQLKPDYIGWHVVKSVGLPDEVSTGEERIRVLDLEATGKHLMVGFDLNSSGTSDSVRKNHRRVMILNRDGSDRIDQDSERALAGWRTSPSFYQTGVATFECIDYGPIVLVEMGRCAEGDHRWDAEVFERGFMVFTDEGEAFYPLRGVDFRNLQVVDGAVWGWRLTPGGIILSRYPTPH